MRFAYLIMFSMLAFGQEPHKVAQPPEPSAPVLSSTAKFWRLVAEAQSARQAMLNSAEGKASAAADVAVQAEQARKQTECGTDFILDINRDEKSPNFKDLVCVAKPKIQPLEKGK